MLQKILLVICLMLGLALTAQAEESFEELLAKAQNGDDQAQAELGSMYYMGRGVEPNDAEAFKWLSMTQNHERGPSPLLGFMYLQGRGVERDYDKAHELLLQAAEKRPIVKNIYNEIFHNGKPMRYLDDMIAEAESGDAEAQFELALAYMSAWDVKRDMTASAKWLNAAAEQGHVQAKVHLGLLHTGRVVMEGDPDFTDKAKALYWYTRAAEQGSEEAMWFLAGTYAGDDDVAEPNLAESLKWHIKIIEGGNAFAAQMLADYYYEGRYFAQDRPEALKWYLKAAEMGSTTAMLKLAGFYRTGELVVQDADRALAWQIKAAVLLEPHAQYSLAEYYLRGFYGGKNEKLAQHWQSLSQGLEGFEAIHILGALYAGEMEIEQDIDAALKWHAKAAENGNEKSLEFLGRFYSGAGKEYGVEPDYAEAAKWFMLGAEQDNVTALYELGRMYLEGQGIRQDYIQAYILTALAYVKSEYSWVYHNKYQAVLKQDIAPMMTEAQIKEAREILLNEGFRPEQYL